MAPVKNTTPSWKSAQQTGVPANVVNSPTVAAVFGQKIDGSSGQAEDLTYFFSKSTRTLDDAFGDIASVVTLGAVNDGQTDCTALFLALLGVGGTFYVPAGNYLITDNAILMSNNARFVGPGMFVYGTSMLPAGESIKANLTLLVPAVFPQPNNALGYLKNRLLGDGVTVTIHIQDGTYAGWAVTVPAHPQGNQINLIGNSSNRDSVVIQIDQTNAGKFVFVSNARFGLVNGMTVLGIKGWQSTGVWDTSITPYGGAVWGDQGGTVTVGSLFYSEKMYYGIRADHGASILVQPNVLVNEYGDVGYHAYGGGVIYCPQTFADTGAHASVGLGAGYLAEFGATIQAEQANSTHAGMYGAAAISNGTIWGQGIVSSYAGKYAAFAANGGHGIFIAANSEQSDFGYSSIGVRAQMGGTIELAGAKVHNNSLDGVSASASSIDFTGGVSSDNGGCGVIARNCSVVFGASWTSGTTAGNKSEDVSDATSILNADPTI